MHQPTSAAEERSIAIKQADPVVIFTWRLLNEAIRADSAMPWVTLDKACGCAPDIPCRHFQDARLAIQASDRMVVYRLIHDLTVDGEVVVSDAVGGRWPD